MKLKFWKKEKSHDKRESILKIVHSTGSLYVEHYVCAQSPEEAKELLKDIQKEQGFSVGAVTAQNQQSPPNPKVHRWITLRRTNPETFTEKFHQKRILLESCLQFVPRLTQLDTNEKREPEPIHYSKPQGRGVGIPQDNVAPRSLKRFIKRTNQK